MGATTRVSSFLLSASAVSLSYFIVLVAEATPKFFEIGYSASPSEARILMPNLTRIVVDYPWVFASTIILACILAMILLRRSPSRTIEIATIGLCAQGTIFWLTMFCIFAKSFEGPMCLHHGPEFEFFEFIAFGSGVFPVTLAALLLLVVALFYPRLKMDK